MRVTEEFYKNELRPFVKRHRPRAVGQEGRADILQLLGYLRMQNETTRGRKRKGVALQVARMLGRDINVISEVWSQFVEQRDMDVRDAPVNRVSGASQARVPRTSSVRKKVQTFMREQREQRRFTTAVEILDFLVREGIVKYDGRSKTAHNTALRSVQRYVKGLGFKRGTKKGSVGWALSEKNEALLQQYLRIMKANREAPVGQRRRIITQDESYIHENYQRTDSLYDPEDDEDKHAKKAPKGRRFCFIGAALGPDLNVDEKERSVEQQGRFLDFSLDVFLGGTRKRTGGKLGGQQKAVSSGDTVATLRAFTEKLGLPTEKDGKKLTKADLWRQLKDHEREHPGALKAEAVEVGSEEKHERDGLQPLNYSGKFNHQKKDTKDYHGMFDHNYMVQWMELFLTDLETHGIRNTIIVMDNAKYHKKLPPDIPSSTAKKSEIAAALTRLGVPYDVEMGKAELVVLMQEHVKKHVPFVLVDMARRASHELIFSPPHHSDLQPIEIVWAQTKQAVARQYNADTKIGDVFQRLNDAFKALGPRQIDGCFRTTLKQEEKLLEHYELVERAEAAGPADDGTDVEAMNDDSSDGDGNSASEESECSESSSDEGEGE